MQHLKLLSEERLVPYLPGPRTIAGRMSTAAGCYFGIVSSLGLSELPKVIPRHLKGIELVRELLVIVGESVKFSCPAAFYSDGHPATFFLPWDRALDGSYRDSGRDFVFREPLVIQESIGNGEGVIWIRSETGVCGLSFRGPDVCGVHAHISRIKIKQSPKAI